MMFRKSIEAVLKKQATAKIVHARNLQLFYKTNRAYFKGLNQLFYDPAPLVRREIGVFDPLKIFSAATPIRIAFSLSPASLE